VQGVLGSGTPVNYASNISYDPTGPIASLTLGNGIAEKWTFGTAQKQPTQLAATGGPGSISATWIWGYGAATADNGNVMTAGIVNSAGGVNASQSFTYDALNRLSTSSEGSVWTRNYSYDAFGNGWVSSATGIALSANTATAQSNFDVNNRLNVNLSSYDSAGNQKSIGGSAGFANTFDAENRMVTANLSGTSSTGYVYDGDGRRVPKVTCPLGTSPCTPSSTGAVVSETYVYDGAGTLTAEYGTVPTAPCTTCYLTVDALGSTRMMTDAGGAMRSLHDYLPFGEEILAGVGSRSSTYYTSGAPLVNDGVAQKFTGKLRDNETGLDFFGARYFSGAQGRFTTPDWSARPEAVPYADLTDPQTLNLYGYVRNNPLNKIDADGHWDLGQTVSDAWETGTGYVRGAAASLSYGLVGGPKSTDSPQSRVGQALGTSAVGIEGIKHMVAGGTKATLATAAAPETGVSALAVPGAVVEAVAGAVVTVGAVKNAVALANTPMESRANPLSGQPGSTSTTTQPSGDPKQVRRYGQDGHAETDVDYGHDHGQGDPHAHDWGRPADGGAPTHTDRAPGRPVKPGDPQP
jgi:RHS repeat-associated protein